MKKALKGENDRKTRPTRSPRTYTALEKCQAVLAVWTERRTVSDVCRELSITWSHLSQWQDRALEAMVRALETRRRSGEQRPPALTERLEKLLAKRGKKKGAKTPRADLETRSADRQEPPQTEKT